MTFQGMACSMSIPISCRAAREHRRPRAGNAWEMPCSPKTHGAKQHEDHTGIKQRIRLSNLHFCSSARLSVLYFPDCVVFFFNWETQVGEIFHTSTNNFWGINWKERWCSHFATHLLFCYDNDLKHEASHLLRPRLAHETASSAAREVMNHVPWRSVTKPKPKPAELKRKGYHLRWFTIWMTRISRIPVDHPFEPMILPLFLYLPGRMPQIKPSCQVRLRVKFSSRIVYNSSNKINSMIIMIVIKIVYK